MPKFATLYYPTYEPPAAWLRSFLLFFDTISTVVPSEAEAKFSQDFLRLVDALPDSYAPLPPTQEDITPDAVNFGRLERAFQLFSEKARAQESGGYTFTFKNGGVGIENHVFMHDKKISKEVKQLLLRFDLIKPELKDFANLGGLPDYSVVNTEASDLLLSLVADKIASRHGCSTVTDQQIGFTVNSLNAVDASRHQRAVADKLACSIISCEVPEDIQFVEPAKYKEIRDAFHEVREPFHRSMMDLTNLWRLGEIRDPGILEQRLKEATVEFDAEVQKLKQSNFGRQFRKWAPIGVGSLVTLIGAVFAGPIVAIPTASISVTVQLFQTISAEPPDPDRVKVQRLIGRMQKDVVDAAEVNRLA